MSDSEYSEIYENPEDSNHNSEVKVNEPKCLLMRCDGTHYCHKELWKQLLDEYVTSVEAMYTHDPNNQYVPYEDCKTNKDSTPDEIFAEYKESFDDTAQSPYKNGTDSVSKWLTLYMEQFIDEIIGERYEVTYFLNTNDTKLASILTEEMPTLPIKASAECIVIKRDDIDSYIRKTHVYDLPTPRSPIKTKKKPKPRTSYWDRDEYNPELLENKKCLYKVISSTEVYEDATQYASRGRFQTEETITFKYLREVYEVTFDFSFSYDDSNGINLSSYHEPNKLTKNGTLIFDFSEYKYDEDKLNAKLDELFKTDDEKYLIQLARFLVDDWQSKK